MTPAPIATTLSAAGWLPLSADIWQRPGAHPDQHAWSVAEYIQRTNEPRHAPPPVAPDASPRPRKPGFAMRGANQPKRAATATSIPRPRGQPRKVELIRRVASLHEGGKTFAEIAAEIGGTPSRAYYLFSQATKLPIR